MSNKLPIGIFPSQAVSDAEKADVKYGLEVARAIESEWFRKDTGTTRYHNNRDSFHRLRLYARGEQPVQKYKDQLAINGDLSYLNLDWKPVPIIPKFVDIVVNGIEERAYDIKAYSQDPFSIERRTQYVESIMRDMQTLPLINEVQAKLGINIAENDLSKLPQTTEELELHMQLEYKQSIEIASEQAINNVLDHNKYNLIKKRLDYDLVTIGIACAKNSFTLSDGIKIEYVDPANLVYSYTESPYFDDIYYVGEIRRVTIPELKKQYPNLTEEEVKEIEQKNTTALLYNRNYVTPDSEDTSWVYVLYFEYKTYSNQVYKIKELASGASKALKKDDTFNPPKDDRSRFEKIDRAIEVLYTGAKVIGMENLLEWKLAENMTRPKTDTTKVQMSYNIVAPRMYQGRIESLVGRMTSYADAIQIDHLKLQQVIARLVPDGVYLDADGIAEIDLGNGTNYSPQDALDMYFQTGSVIGRSMTQDGEFNHGKVPIQELNSNGGNSKIAALINSYNYHMQMLRDVTGLNEARDGSMPDSNALVGLQKLAAANSNTATRHILQGGLYLTLKTAESVSLRISDVLEFSPTRNNFIQSIGKFNVGALDQVSELHLHDFGIFLELAPDAEEKQMLENNIQMALSRDQIYLEDAIDVREVKNLKLANQLLKIRRKKKQQNDRAMQLENVQAQSQSNAQAAQAAAQAEAQKEQAITQMKAQLAQVQAQIDMQKLEKEAELKKQLMAEEFNYNVQLKQLDLQVINDKERFKEDRKDQRTKIQASQQSELIEQRKGNAGPKSFESSGADTMGGLDFSQFGPK